MQFSSGVKATMACIRQLWLSGYLDLKVGGLSMSVWGTGHQKLATNQLFLTWGHRETTADPQRRQPPLLWLSCPEEEATNPMFFKGIKYGKCCRTFPSPSPSHLGQGGSNKRSESPIPNSKPFPDEITNDPHFKSVSFLPSKTPKWKMATRVAERCDSVIMEHTPSLSTLKQPPQCQSEII